METEKNNKLQPENSEVLQQATLSNKVLKWKMPFIIGLIVLFFISVPIFISKKNTNQPSKKTSFPHTSPSILPSLTDSKAQESYFSLHEFSSTGLKPIETFSLAYDGSFGNSTPLKIDNNIFFAGKDTVYSLELGKKEKKVVYKTGFSDRNIMSITVGSNNRLYVSIEPAEYYSEDSKFTVVEVDIQSGQKIREIGPLDHVFYGGINYVFNTGNSDIIASFGGDGCGGWGTISRVRDNSMTEIAQSGGGCIDKPRYLGFDETKKLIMLAAILPFEGEYVGDENIKYDVVYGVDVETKTQVPLFDLKSIQDAKKVLLDSKTQTLAILSSNKITLVDLNKKSVINTIDTKDIKNFHQWEFKDGLISGLDYNNKEIIIIDIVSKQITTGQKINLEGELLFLGSWNNKKIYGSY